MVHFIYHLRFYNALQIFEVHYKAGTIQKAFVGVGLLHRYVQHIRMAMNIFTTTAVAKNGVGSFEPENFGDT